MNSPASLRLIPSNSPFFRGSTPRSPIKGKSQELGLSLKQVIGTTTSSINGFDCLPDARSFAFTAGAAAVIACVDEDLKITQRFFRARPVQSGSGYEVNGYAPISPTPNASAARNRTLNHVREHSSGLSPLSSSGREWSESPTGKTAGVKERVKAATSVALSPNGKWLAVGETGYKPRVLIFSTANEASADTPVAALSEHTFGVHALAFSSDSKFLASLGTVNDGFLYIWSIDDRTGIASLHASNKCTSLVRQIAWMDRTLVTVGLRFVKVWRPDEEASSDGPRNTDFGSSVMNPRLKTLAGRNSLLGSLLEASFVAVVPVSSTKSLICAETGEICLLDDTSKMQTFTHVANAGFRVTAAMLCGNNKLHVAGAISSVRSMDLDSLYSGEHLVSPVPTLGVQSKIASSGTANVTAMAAIQEIVITLDSNRAIKLCSFAADRQGEMQIRTHQLPAHDDPVLGIRTIDGSNSLNAAFCTFSGNGTILLWDSEGVSKAKLSVPVESTADMYGLTNELRSIGAFCGGTLIAAGDKYGNLTILDMDAKSILTSVRAHSGEITDVAVSEYKGGKLLATSSRDRTVQVFTWKDSTLALLQTLDEHAGAVTGLLFAKEGAQLLSCSADRTVVIREAILRAENDPQSIAFMMLRTITMKSTPTSMCLTPYEDTLLVSTIDRCIGKFNTRNGQAGFSFKCSDGEGGEAAVMSKIVHVTNTGSPVIAGVSSSDKSIRLYTEYGMLLARDWGHTEGITDVAFLPSRTGDASQIESPTRLVTVAADSTIFIWDTASAEMPQQGLLPSGSAETPMSSTPTGPPLRKVISVSELARHRQRSSDDGEPTSPTAISTPTGMRSPQRLRKKTSRMSVAGPTPRLEAGFRPSLAEPSRRASLRHRSPSPPSPRNARLSNPRRPSIATTPRAKSSDNIHANASTDTKATSSTNNTGFGSLTASTESVCRTLRAYRKKLASSSETLLPESLRELEKELKLTARTVGEKATGNSLDEAMIVKLLDQASEKIVGLLDERIKERVQSEVRKSSESTPQPEIEAVAGALEKSRID